jgi:hypothetical protein
MHTTLPQQLVDQLIFEQPYALVLRVKLELLHLEVACELAEARLQRFNACCSHGNSAPPITGAEVAAVTDAAAPAVFIGGEVLTLAAAVIAAPATSSDSRAFSSCSRLTSLFSALMWRSASTLLRFSVVGSTCSAISKASMRPTLPLRSRLRLGGTLA